MSGSKQCVAFWDWQGDTLRLCDVTGGSLLTNIVEDSEVQCLIWWLKCIGFSASSSKAKMHLSIRFVESES